MRLYLSGDSKNKVGYTPDTLIIENGDKRYEYDIQGETDYDTESLSCRTKGEFFKRNDITDDYDELTEKEDKELLNLLKDKNSEVIIAIYPATMMCDNEDEIFNRANDDEISNCSATLRLNDKEVNFNFRTEFYGR
jgi:hypothetical protein